MTWKSQLRAGVGAAAAIAVAAPGCGSSDDGGANAKRFSGDAKPVAAVFDRLTTAAKDGDTTEICADIFSHQLAGQIGTRTHGCEAEVQQKLVADDARFDVDQIRVVGDVAAAKIFDKNQKVSLTRLGKQGGDWRITKITTP